MFKKGQLLFNKRIGAYSEVVAWPLVCVVRGVKHKRYCAGFMYHANGNGHILIGNNYKAKE